MRKIELENKKKKNKIEEEILFFLKQIESGEIVLKPKNEPQKIFADFVLYETEDGSSITVFNDCNEWDFIDSIKLKNKKLNYKQLSKYKKVFNYRPTNKIAREKYKIPGHCSFRCNICGKKLPNADVETKSYICKSCKN